MLESTVVPRTQELSDLASYLTDAREAEKARLAREMHDELGHGHNMLLPTALVRLANVSAFVRPYAGFGFGAAIPHVEVWPAGEGDPARTNEYQLAGTAAQFVVGLEIPLSKGPLFIEYKFTYANLDTLLTTGKTPSWCNCDFVSDFSRHIARWWRGEAPLLGSLQTTIATHQVVAGAGYRTRP